MKRITSIGLVILIIFTCFYNVLHNYQKPKDNDIEINNISNNDNPNTQINKENCKNIKDFFTKNQGQFENDEIYFTYSNNDKTFGFSKSYILIKLSESLEDNKTKSSIIKITFENSNKAIPKGIEELNHKSNYFIGNNISKWKNNIPNYEKIIYENLYDGIDLIYYFCEDGLKYDWILKTGAQPEQIRYSYEGVKDINIDLDGNLHLITTTSEYIEKSPYSYQNYDTKKIEIYSKYWIEGTTVGFKIGDYNPDETLIIDPLIFSTFVGGSESDNGMAVAMDTEGNIYVTGDTYSEDFPITTGVYDESFNGVRDIFVFKMNNDGTNIIYATYIGGNDNDVGHGITIDEKGDIYVTGRSESSDFPTTPGAYDENINGESDVIIFKLKNDCSDLIYSTFVGGMNYEVGFAGVVVDSNHNAYVAGHTNSGDFPTTPGAYDRLYYAAGWDGFAFKLNPDGSDLIYSTYFGGWDYDGARSISIDSNYNLYLGGDTTSDDFPTTSGAYDETYNGARDAFLLEFNSDGSDLIYSTFHGGSDNEIINAMILKDDTSAWITGYTFSQDFPVTPGAYDLDVNGERDFFISHINQGGSDLLYSTFVGGQATDEAWTIAVSNEIIYVGGRTSSDDFPITNNAYDDNLTGEMDIIILELDTESSNLTYSTYIGGNERENVWGMILFDEELYITGLTSSEDFPTTPNAYDNDYNGGHIDIIVLKMSTLSTQANIQSINPNPALSSENIHFQGEENENIEKYVWRSSFDGVLYNGTEPEFDCDNLSLGNHKIYLKVLDIFDQWSIEIFDNLTIHKKPTAIIDKKDPNSAIEGETINFNGKGTDDGTIKAYEWSSSIDGFLSDEKSFSLSNLSIGEHTIYFKVKDNYDVWSVVVTETLTILPKEDDEFLPDLTIYENDISFSNDNPVEDEMITINARSYNNGDLNAVVTVEFYKGNPNLNGLIINTVTITIDSKTSEIASIEWKTDIGEHEIFVKVTDSARKEVDISNNIASKKLVVEERSSKNGDDDFNVLWITPPIGIIFVVFLGIFAYKKKKGKEEFKGFRCPKCISKMEYFDDYSDYYCWECEEYFEDM